MAITWKGSILDTYEKNSKFGGDTKGFDDVKKVGGTKPISTDFIKGINPQQAALSYTGDAAAGFTPKLSIGDKNKTEFKMVVDNKDTFNSFKPLNTNVQFNKTKKYKKPANP